MSRVTDYEAVRWLLDGTKESAEDADWDVEVDDELLESWSEFVDAVFDALWDPSSPLSDDETEGVYGPDSAAEVAIDVYHTITGAGVDVADGRWDHHFSAGNDKAEEVAEYLRQHKGLAEHADDSGAGKLNDALWEAVYRQKPKAGRGSTRRSMQRRKQPKRNPQQGDTGTVRLLRPDAVRDGQHILIVGPERNYHGYITHRYASGDFSADIWVPVDGGRRGRSHHADVEVYQTERGWRIRGWFGGRVVTIWDRDPPRGQRKKRSMQRKKQPKRNPSATIRKYLRGL